MQLAILRQGDNETGHTENPGAEFSGRTRRLLEGPSVAWGMQEMLKKGSTTSVTGVQYGPLASIRHGVSAVFLQYGIQKHPSETTLWLSTVCAPISCLEKFFILH